MPLDHQQNPIRIGDFVLVPMRVVHLHDQQDRSLTLLESPHDPTVTLHLMSDILHLCPADLAERLLAPLDLPPAERKVTHIGPAKKVTPS